LAKEFLLRDWSVSYIKIAYGRFFLSKYQDEGIKFYSIPYNRFYKKVGVQEFVFKFFFKKLIKKIDADFWYNRAANRLLPYLVQFKKEKHKIVWACAHDDQVQPNSFEKYYNDKKLGDKIIWALRKSDIKVFQTQYQEREAKKNLGISGYVVANGQPLIIRNEKNFKREKNILWVGRLRQWKHPERFVELSRLFQRSGYKFYVIGAKGEKEVENFLLEAEQKIENLFFWANYLTIVFLIGLENQCCLLIQVMRKDFPIPLLKHGKKVSQYYHFMLTLIILLLKRN
jgi:glycosyltransferase involved in cell wall biosynthesis